ncbi:MAG TPA: hypothetical protein VJG90_01190 [Candidatus Nanoarchaeia archaeon]|nr:hypothetical protein [Candidatus Nanoarchaeia archaeon]
MRTLICPKCGDTKIATFASQSGLLGGGVQPQLECRSCGFVSFTFPEIDKEKTAAFRKQIRI